ncbi:MAG: Arm DNA-binding domain-containing protein [Bacteroidota bacterium]
MFHRKDAPKKNGTLPIYIDARVNKKRGTLSTSIYEGLLTDKKFSLAHNTG